MHKFSNKHATHLPINDDKSFTYIQTNMQPICPEYLFMLRAKLLKINSEYNQVVTKKLLLLSNTSHIFPLHEMINPAIQ